MDDYKAGMRNEVHLNWHPEAVLVGPDGQRIGSESVHSACITPASDPKKPLQALPQFFAALQAGRLHLIGKFDVPKAKAKAGDFLTLSGGSTGTPKIILRSAASWLHSIQILQMLLEITPAARVAAISDLSHSLALYAGVEALTLGAEFHTLHGLRLSKLVREIQSRKVTHLYATPTQLRLLTGPPTASVQFVIIGGGAVDSRASEHSKSLFPNAKFFRFYGAAETSFITLADETTPILSVGRTFRGVEIDIRNTSGSRLSAGRDGMIWVKSPMLFTRYVSGSSPDTERQVDWLSIGEIGSLDANGNLTVKGRAGRVINIADQLVYLDQIEAVLLADPAVKNAAALAVPNTLHGFNIVAAIQVNAGDLNAIKITANTALPLLSRPRKLILIDDWPMLPSGKTDYKELELRIGVKNL